MKKRSPQSRPQGKTQISNAVVLLAFGTLAFFGAIGFGRVWLHQQITQTAQRNKEVVTRIADLERRLDTVNAQVASSLSPNFLLAQNERLRLELARPREAQVVRINEDVDARLAQKRHQQFFSSTPVRAGPPPR
jgi:cell division protein FtsB